MSVPQRTWDQAVAAVSLIEEACLRALLEDLAHSDATNGMSVEEITHRIGLSTWLGLRIGALVVEKVLQNLSGAGKAELVAQTPTGSRWTIAESEAAIRPIPAPSEPMQRQRCPMRNRRK